MRVQVLKKHKQWYWRIIALNGEIVAASETYSSRHYAIKTAKRVFEGKFKSFDIMIDDK